MSDKPEVILYTDGACIGNPGPGGFGVVLLHGKHRKELSGGFRKTTNNRMEMMAAIVGLETLKKPCRVLLYSDSQYLVKAAMLGWANKWKSRGWKKARGEQIKNPDLWQRLLNLLEIHDVKMKWVQGHAGNTENEHCDQLAVKSSKGKNLPADIGFEQRRSSSLQF